MGDRSKFGMAKSLFSLGTDAGVDMSDPDQVSAHIERYNDLTIDERKDLLSDHLFANAGPSTPDRRLAPVIMPTDDEISRSLTSIPILPKFRDLVIFLGKGRPLTKKDISPSPTHGAGGPLVHRRRDGPPLRRPNVSHDIVR